KNYGYLNDNIDEISFGVDEEGNLIGYVVVVTTNQGYNGEITIVVGLEADATITGISFLTLDESPGLGMEADKDKFKSQFTGKNVGIDGFNYTKTGAVADNEIDALSGATITTSAVVNAVNAAVTLVVVLGGE
ncbi:MAG: FMN-binding protein, partial [Lachnospiraceae bacterium]|nr:FMN-binding protein [Lachnospiraceae bacterium]